MAADNDLKLVLHSFFEEMEKLEPFVNHLQEQLLFGDDLHGRILLTLSEAVNNAIVHGNGRQEDKEVVVIAGIDDKQLTLSVEDQGEGFDPDDIPDPLKKENLLNEGGRGIFLIKKYANEVDFKENGSKTVMTFRLD